MSLALRALRTAARPRAAVRSTLAAVLLLGLSAGTAGAVSVSGWVEGGRLRLQVDSTTGYGTGWYQTSSRECVRRGSFNSCLEYRTYLRRDFRYVSSPYVSVSSALAGDFAGWSSYVSPGTVQVDTGLSPGRWTAWASQSCTAGSDYEYLRETRSSIFGSFTGGYVSEGSSSYDCSSGGGGAIETGAAPVLSSASASAVGTTGASVDLGFRGYGAVGTVVVSARAADGTTATATASASPSSNDGVTSLRVPLTGLTPGTSYTWSATITTAYGQAEVPSMSFTTGAAAPPADTTPPVITASLDRSGLTKQTTATATWSTDDPEAALTCRLDEAVEVACASPLVLAGLTEGTHSLVLAARDAAGNVASKALGWTVDLTPPGLDLEVDRSGTVDADTATATFRSDDEKAEVTCEVDDAARACSSPLALAGLGDGAHAVTVTVTDVAGNQTRRSASWSVDTTTPVVTLDLGVASPTTLRAAAPSWSVSEDGAEVTCAVDDGAAEPCAAPLALSGLTVGGHSLTVVAKDAAGHVGRASAAWTVTADPARADEDKADGAALTVGTTGGASAADPLGVTLDLPASTPAGDVSIRELPKGDGDVDPGALGDLAGLLDRVVVIDAPEATSGDPMTFTFDLLATGLPASALRVFRNGTELPACTPATTLSLDGTVACVASVTAPGTDRLRVTVRTLHASTWSFGASAPVTVLDDAPGATKAGTGRFAFHATVDGSTSPAATFTCSIDSGAEEPCGAGVQDGTWDADLSGLGDGAHTAHVRATVAGIDGPATDAAFTVDRTAPVADVGVDRPAATTSTSARVTWTVTDASATSESCELDGEAYAPCVSPAVLSGLGEGTHTFSVSPTDALGTAGPAASASWRVDTTPPSTAIDRAPDALTRQTTATFALSSDDGSNASPPLTFRCRLDGGSWASCSSTPSFPGLADGPHELEVVAADALGTEDATPVTASWTVDTTPPAISIAWPRDGGRYPTRKDVLAEWSCTDLHGPVTKSGSVASGEPIDRRRGAHDFEVTCVDAVGNTASRTRTYRAMEFPEIVQDDNPVAYLRMDAADGGGSPALEFKEATQSGPVGISGDGDRAWDFLGALGYGFANGLASPERTSTFGAWVRLRTERPAQVLDHGYDAGLFLRDPDGSGPLGLRFTARHRGTTVADTRPGAQYDVTPGDWWFAMGRRTSTALELWTATGEDLLPERAGTAPAAEKSGGRSTFYVGYGQDEPWFDGQIDEVVYFPSALSVQHVEELWMADPPAEVAAKAPAAPAQAAPVDLAPAAAAQGLAAPAPLAAAAAPLVAPAPAPRAASLAAKAKAKARARARAKARARARARAKAARRR